MAENPCFVHIKLPATITGAELIDLADILYDLQVEYSYSDPSVGIFEVPQAEIELLKTIEAALRNEVDHETD